MIEVSPNVFFDPNENFENQSKDFKIFVEENCITPTSSEYEEDGIYKRAVFEVFDFPEFTIRRDYQYQHELTHRANHALKSFTIKLTPKV